VLTFDLALGAHRYDDKQVVLTTYRRLWESLKQLPGVSAAGGVTSLPLSQAFAWTPITIEGREPLPGEKFINADERVVGGEYFQAMDIPLRRGRFFNERDTMDTPRVVLIDEYMAQQFWPNEDPIGKRIHVVQLKTGDSWQTVVGVVGRVKHDSLDSEPRIAFYLAQTQFPAREMSVVLRGKVESAGLTSALKKEIREIDPDLPMTAISTMTQRVDESLARRRFGMVLLAVFAGLALVLATMGIYGVMAYLVSQGTRELGIRMALGATRGDILSLVVRQGMVLASAGVAIGLAGAFVFTRLLRSLLFGVGATDPLTFGAITVLLGATALLASYIPARRAARIDPIASLRCE
jgi:predicted permease